MIAPTIYVVDDDVSFRTATGTLLAACGYEVALFESARQLLDLLSGDEAGCILLDVQMADLTGPQFQDQLAARGCKLPIVFVTGHADVPTAVKTIKGGADDFLTKPIERVRLLAAIESALNRLARMREQDTRMTGLRSSFAELTAREADVFSMLVRGKPHKQIAYALGVSERTIKVHRRNVLQKFEVQSLAELAVIAERLGLLQASGHEPGDVRQSHAASLPGSPVTGR